MAVIIGVSGYQLTSADIARLTDPLVSGVILFSRNYQNPQQLQALTAAIRDIKPDILIGVDHEGGRVQRFHESFTKLPAMGEIGQYWHADPVMAKALAFATGYIMGYELRQYHIDMGISPVLDLNRQLNSVIGDRSFSDDPDIVIELGAEYCRGAHASGVLTIGKHFPGHGGVTHDTHHETAIDNRELAELQSDLAPFVTLLKQQLLNGIMPAHVIYSAIDDVPAGFSHTWLTAILKQQYGFEGMIISDCLTMQAAHLEGGIAQAALQALNAGCSHVLICHQLEKIPDILQQLRDTLADDFPMPSKPDIFAELDEVTYHAQLMQLADFVKHVAEANSISSVGMAKH